MSITTTLAACNTNPALNGPDGSTDLPSVMDDAVRYALSFIAQLRDGGAIPAGAIVNFPTTTTPAFWLKCNGQLVSRTTYATLFAFASASGLVTEAAWTAGSFGAFSVGDGSTTFRLPDLRAMHIRGLDESRGTDPGRVFGVWQDHMIFSHTHGISDPTHAHAVADPTHSHSINDPTHSHSVSPSVFQVGGTFNVQGGAGTSMQAVGPTTNAVGTGITLNYGATGIALYGAATGISVVAAGGTENRVRNVAYPFYIKY